MGDDSINDLLLLSLVDIVDVARFMKLCLAPAVALVPLQHLVHADVLLAAGVFILATERGGTHLDLGSLLVEAAVAHLGDGVVLHAAVALEQVQIRPDLPVDFFPTDTVSFTNKRHKFLQVPVAIDYVLRSHLAVRVDEAGALAAAQHLALLFGEQLVAVSTLVQVILVLLK